MAIERISAEELDLDRRFDNGKDVLQYFDLKSARQPDLETRRMNVDFPDWMFTVLIASRRSAE